MGPFAISPSSDMSNNLGFRLCVFWLAAQSLHQLKFQRCCRRVVFCVINCTVTLLIKNAQCHSKIVVAAAERGGCSATRDDS